MIAYLSGILRAKRENSATIDIGGVGYHVLIPLSTYRELPSAGEPATLFTHLYFREDDIRLYGFASEEEREAFQILMGVSGVGAKVALDILSHLPISRLAEAVQKGEAALLCQVPGIGKKRADRLLFELKGISHPLFLVPAGTETRKIGPRNANIIEAEEALIALGCKPLEAQRAILAAVQRLGDQAQTPDLIKEGLRHRQGAA
ncbi:MAG: Holliday junction branch migration protein RuvA [Candidatus Omnitrophota bacterium]